MASAAAANAPKRPRTNRGVQAETKAAAAAAAAAADGGSSGRVVTQELPLLESLAELMGLPVRAAAQQLLGMTPDQRLELRRGFAERDGVGQGGAATAAKVQG